jgi:integrase/recombinase XerD
LRQQMCSTGVTKRMRPVPLHGRVQRERAFCDDRPKGTSSQRLDGRLNRGARISSRLLRCAFQRLRTHSGVRRKGPQCPPRLHDLRHAAAVHRLTAWYREGKDVQRLLPLLSTYLGHVDIASTQLYLTLTPELLHEANQRFAQYVFGEVSHG